VFSRAKKGWEKASLALQPGEGYNKEKKGRGGNAAGRLKKGDSGCTALILVKEEKKDGGKATVGDFSWF